MKNRKQTQPEQTPRPPAGCHQPGQDLLLHQPLLLGRNGPAGHGQERVLGKFRLAIPEPVPGDDKRQGVKGFFPEPAGPVRGFLAPQDPSPALSCLERAPPAGSPPALSCLERVPPVGSPPRPLLLGEGAARRRRVWRGHLTYLAEPRQMAKPDEMRRGRCPHRPETDRRER